MRQVHVWTCAAVFLLVAHTPGELAAEPFLERAISPVIRASSASAAQNPFSDVAGNRVSAFDGNRLVVAELREGLVLEQISSPRVSRA